jgi:hypothetical protein
MQASLGILVAILYVSGFAKILHESGLQRAFIFRLRLRACYACTKDHPSIDRTLATQAFAKLAKMRERVVAQQYLRTVNVAFHFIWLGQKQLIANPLQASNERLKYRRVRCFRYSFSGFFEQSKGMSTRAL